jgi:hypothetical protein
MDFRGTATVAAPCAVSSEEIPKKVLLHQHMRSGCPKGISNASVLKAVQRKNARIIYESFIVVVSPGWITISQMSVYYLALNSPEEIG